jgi:hypothetical protein
LITFIKHGLKVFANVVDYEKAKVHREETTRISKGWQPTKIDLKLKLNKKIPRFDQMRSGGGACK